MHKAARPVVGAGHVPGTGGLPDPVGHGRRRRVGANPLVLVRDQYRRQVSKTPDIRMVPGVVRVAGRRLRFAVSDNEEAFGPDGAGSPPIWAVNIHGYFAGGAMYWRESARLAERLGWRVVNPSLPGFGGSDPFGWNEVTIEAMAEQVQVILERVDAGPVVLLGHSMGGAVAVRYAHDRPGDTLGILYRDGVATPAWKMRRGVLPTLMAPFAPEAAPLFDMMAAVVLDTPDLFIGRMYSTMRSVLPDIRRNLRTMGQTLPVGSMLMTVDLRPEVRALAAQNLPILPEWGCFDRVANGATAAEFSGLVRVPTQWVPGGHSWMLARPGGQADVLVHLPAGQRFMREVEDRWRRMSSRQRALRALP